jgi:small subunit ribosomal protein S1
VGEKGWRVLEKALESGELVKGKILGFNRGGSIVESEGVQAFVPMSQLVSVSRDVFREVRSQMDRAEEQATTEEQDGAEEQAGVETQDGAETQDEAEAEDQDGAEVQDSAEEQDSQPEEPEPPDEIGKELELKVLEVNRSRNRAILSERQAVQSMRERRKAELIKELSVGEVRTGKVTGISSFGAFVDLGGADGLVHISELTWTPVSSPEEVVHLGQDVEVYVLRVDAENNKIALSLKRLQREPWETITDHVQVDDVVDATVTKLTDFGAFARVEGSVEGLIHISELTSRMIGHPREVVREGDAVKVKVLRIEPERRRLGLSIKQAEEQDQGYDG